MTKEEIIKPLIIEYWESHTDIIEEGEYLKKDDALKCMQEYADQKNAKLNEKLAKCEECAKSVSRDLRANIERQNEQIADLKRKAIPSRSG